MQLLASALHKRVVRHIAQRDVLEDVLRAMRHARIRHVGARQLLEERLEVCRDPTHHMRQQIDRERASNNARHLHERP